MHCQLLKLAWTLMRAHSCRSNSPHHSSSGHPTPLLAVKFKPPRPSVIFHPWWRPSPLPTKRSSSTLAGGQIHPSPPSSHPPLLLAVKFTPLRPSVIFHSSCWHTNSPLPTQRSSSTPAGCSSKPHHFPPSVHLPPVMLEVNFTFPPAIGVQGEGGDEQGRRKTGDERPEMRDERRELKDERQEMWEGKRETGVGLGRHEAEDVRWETGDRRREKW